MKTVLFVTALLLASSAWAQAPDAPKQPAIPESCSAGPVLKDEAGKTIFLKDEQMKARATKKVTPKFPALARTARIQGAVILGVVVGPTGKVKCLWVVHGHPLLYAAAIEAARQWEFKPMKNKSGPIAFAGWLLCNFSSSGGFSY